MAILHRHKICSVKNCNRQALAKGLCHMHYRRKRRTGSVGDSCSLIAGKGLPLKFLKLALKYTDKDSCLIWPYGKGRDGYGQIVRKGKTQRVSRLICMKIKGKPTPGSPDVLHSCGNGHGGCINHHHLYWGSPKQNAIDRIAHGTNAKGEQIANSKLTQLDVIKIKRLQRNGRTDADIARTFNVTRQTIWQIRIGKTWKHVEGN